MKGATVYKIISSRIGVPGDEFIPPAGVSVQALLDGGFIIEVGAQNPTPKPRKNAKVQPTEE